MTAGLFDQLDPPSAGGVTLRPYQADAIAAVHEQWQAHNRTLIVLPTGCGKTVVFSQLAHEVDHGRVLVLAHREELIYQAQAKLHAVTGERPDIEMADYHADKINKRRVVVSSIQTQATGRMSRFNPHEFGLVVVDEAHHAVSPTYRKVLDYYSENPNLKILGVTATPDRTDEKAIGQVFESCAFDYEINDAVDGGWLVPIKQRTIIVDGLDFSKIRTVAGDLNQGQLAELMEYEKNLHEIAGPTLQIAGGRKTLVFATSVAHADRLSEIFNRHQSDTARFVCGKTPKEERRQMFADYRSGKFQILVNVGVATEGFDEPGIELVVIARPTKSRALYAQMVGRGTRPLPGVLDGLSGDAAIVADAANMDGMDIDPAEVRREAIAHSAKPHVEVMDFVGNASKHKLMSVADILGGKYDDEVVELASERVKEQADSSVPANVAEELEKAEQEVHERRKRREDEERRRSVLVGTANFDSRWINPFDVLDIEPPRSREWETPRPPSEKMVALLERKGVTDADQLTYAAARTLIDKIVSRQSHGWCSYKQAKVLQRYGVDPKGVRFNEASRLIDEIKANGWRKP